MGVLSAGALVLGLAACVDADTDEIAARENALLYPSQWVTAQTVTLASGDVADVYAPVVPRPAAPAFEDAFPVVTVLQGGRVAGRFYQGFGRELARHGFVVVIPDHLRAFGPPGAPAVPLTEGNVIGAALEAVALLDADPGSPIFRVADTGRAGVVGHSFGGVVALQLLGGTCAPPFCTPPFAMPPAVGAVAAFGTHMAGPAGVIDIDTHGVGVAVLHGDLDGRASAANVDATYATLDDARAKITIHGANHFGITDEVAPAGAEADPSAPTLAQAAAVRAVATWTGRWFRDQLHADPVAQVWIYVLGGSLDGVVTVDDAVE